LLRALHSWLTAPQPTKFDHARGWEMMNGSSGSRSPGARSDQISKRHRFGLVVAAAIVAAVATISLSVAGAGSVTSVTLTVVAAADAMVSKAEPTRNFGTSTVLRLKYESSNAYVKFNVTGITGAVTSAKLRLYVTDPSSAATSVHRTSSTWTETGITWNNAPVIGGTALSSRSASTSGTWLEFGLGSAVTANGTYSFGLKKGKADAVSYSSREATNKPKLVVTFSSEATATATAQPTTTSGSAVLVGAGDIASCSNSNDEATAKLLDAIPGTVFTTGDNVYDSGTTSQFTNCYGPTWGRHKARTKPSPGNHDYGTSGASGYFNYFGVPSYYAYDRGGWRVYALNSSISMAVGSTQEQWLRRDLAANPRSCVLAYWHHPRWSSGSVHGNHTSVAPLVQALYDYRAELIVVGHEHNYERFAQQNPTGARDDIRGIRQIVAGTGGKSHYGFATIKPNSVIRNSTTHGVLKLTLLSNSYSWEFVPVPGGTFRDSGNTPCH
jgi:hypothetical protein